MKRISLVIILFITSLLVIGFSWWNVNSKAPSSSNEKIRFVVEKGKNASQVSQELYKKGLIKSPLAFKFYVQLTGKSKNIQAGEFELSPNRSLSEILEDLSHGPLQLWITVTEGLRREEIVEKFISGLGMDNSKGITFKSEFLLASKDLEGKLFPDTYLFPRDVTAGAVVKRMNNVFNTKLSEILENKKTSLSSEEVVVLASIIERETKTGAERAIVAGILMNRLNIGMPLQVDASVQYAIASEQSTTNISKQKNWWPILTREDLNVDSKFNTYKFGGLPPAPIASAGQSALEAAARPAETEYFYYIHEPKGTIHYARTLDEHNANVRQYLGK